MSDSSPMLLTTVHKAGLLDVFEGQVGGYTKSQGHDAASLHEPGARDLCASKQNPQGPIRVALCMESEPRGRSFPSMYVICVCICIYFPKGSSLECQQIKKVNSIYIYTYIYM